MTDFALDTSLELLQHADELAQAAENDVSTDAEQSRTPGEREKLIRQARKRKKKRLVFFNTGDGLKLRLKIPNHPHVIGDRDIYCALCGQNSTKVFRGHRTNHKCGFCNVHLCVKIRSGFRKSSWEMWHTTKRLKQRAPVGNQVDGVRNSDSSGDDFVREDREDSKHQAAKKEEKSSCASNL